MGSRRRQPICFAVARPQWRPYSEEGRQHVGCQSIGDRGAAARHLRAGRRHSQDHRFHRVRCPQHILDMAYLDFSCRRRRVSKFARTCLPRAQRARRVYGVAWQSGSPRHFEASGSRSGSSATLRLLPPFSELQSCRSRTVVRQRPELRIDAVLTPSSDDKMLAHYGVGRSARRWTTVTPAALPISSSASPRTGSGRAELERRLTLSVVNAVRHAGLPHHDLNIRVQREPFHPRGTLAREFALGLFSPVESDW
jgi:hypothetical protein